MSAFQFTPHPQGRASGALIPLLAAAIPLLAAAPVTAQDGAEDAQAAEEEVVLVIGSRFATERSAAAATAPVDIFGADDIGAVGNAADLTDSLRALAPSYNAPMASGDGDTFVRPTSLRGLAPDQTLVMINGKRRHRAALIAEFVPAAGKGSHGPNIGLIPSIAIDSVQILRDGAAAQYGSDAIAGVINLQMKDAREGGHLSVDYGRFYRGEQSVKFAANGGFALGAEGFLNLSFEHVDNEALSRGVQRPNAQALIDAGVEGVGTDSPFEDAPFVQTWGRPQASDSKFFLNAGMPLGDSAEFYAMGNRAVTDGRYRFFYRAGDNPLTDEDESHITIRSLGIQNALPQGFTPFFDGDHVDYSMIAGVRGETAHGSTYDFSLGVGQDELDFFLANTINPDIGLGANGLPRQRDFDVGALIQEEFGINADFTRRLGDTLRLAYGFEWREETFTVVPGEPSSYQGVGSSGFKGFEPRNAGEFSRDNSAIYGEIEQQAGDRTLLQYALRYENFSDFGGTLNGKLAARFDVNDAFTLRGSINTGFHAPTPGQSNLQKVTTTFDNDTGLQVESGTVRPDHPSALAAGGAPLQEETSIDYSIGFWAGSGETEISADAYIIDIDGRIFKTRSLPFTDPRTGIGSNVQFFTNALDLRVVGIDVVFSRAFEWGGLRTDVTAAYNHNAVDVVRQSAVSGRKPVSDADVEDIENSYPKNRFTLTADTPLGARWDLRARMNYYGRHYDERGRINGVDGGAPTKLIGSSIFFDAELGYDHSEQLRFTLGGSNVFDEYIDEIEAPYANRLNVGLPYARRTAANFEGGSWYLRAAFRW